MSPKMSLEDEAGPPWVRCSVDDLPQINAIVTAAVMAWPLPERVRRLSVPVLCYAPSDFADHVIELAGTRESPWAVIAWMHDTRHAPPYVLLHGIYVRPEMQGRGLGRRLVDAVRVRAAALGAAGVLIKAERVAVPFFERLDLVRLQPDIGPGGAYPHRFWLPCDAQE